MTELEAINRMLRAVGELPVPASVVIDDLPDGHEAKTAKEMLAEVNKELQETGWWFNRENITYTPVADVITIPTTVISISDPRNRYNYVVRSGELYNVTDNTGTFTADLELITITEIDFIDVPAVFQTLVVHVASRELHQFLNADDSTLRYIQRNIDLQNVKVDREDMRNNNYNLIKGTRVIDRSSNPSPLA